MYMYKATVTSNSCDDELQRVTISTPTTPHSSLVPSYNNMPLVNGDRVWVMFDDEISNPIIVGKSIEIGGDVSELFRSSDGELEIKATVKPDTFRLNAGDDISINITKDSLVLNDGNEAMVLGDTLKGLMSDLIDAIANMTVPTSMGPSGTPINSASFIQIKNKLDDMLSKKSKLE